MLASSFTPAPGTAATPFQLPGGLFLSVIVSVVDQNGQALPTTIVTQQLSGGACVGDLPQELLAGEVKFTASPSASCVGQTALFLFRDSQGDTYTYTVVVTAI